MSPTLQRWLASTDHRSAEDPYFLYAAGNAGSLLALLAYPLLIEPALDLRSQARWWAPATACSSRSPPPARRWHAPPPPSAHRPRRRRTPRRRSPARTRCAGRRVAAVPSALLLGVTRHLATDVASVPLLWVLPLAIYLLTFVVAFSPRRPRMVQRASAAAAVSPSPPCSAGPARSSAPPSATPLVATIALAAFAAVSLAAHRRLWDRAPRPPTSRPSTCGSPSAASSAAPPPRSSPRSCSTPSSSSRWPWPPAWPCCRPRRAPAARAVPPASSPRRPRRRRLALAVGVGRLHLLGVAAIAVWAGSAFRRSPRAGAAVVVGVVVLVTTVGTPGLLHRDRTFYGVSQVAVDGGAHVLQSGTTVHGVQRIDPAVAGEPLAYYSRSGPIGQVFAALGDRARPLDVGVVGLGAGTLAAYAGRRPLIFYEIDPAVVHRRRPALFTYLADAAGAVDVEVGDGRLLLERAEGRHDLLVLDAFSSDAIPVHLLTREAFAVYADHLARRRPGRPRVEPVLRPRPGGGRAGRRRRLDVLGSSTTPSPTRSANLALGRRDRRGALLDSWPPPVDAAGAGRRRMDRRPRRPARHAALVLERPSLIGEGVAA